MSEDKVTNPELQYFLRLGEVAMELEIGRSYIIGRDVTCSVRLGHGSVAPFHCQLEVTKQGVLAQNLASPRFPATRINGELIQVHVWMPGQTLELGNIQASLEERRAEKVATIGLRQVPMGTLLQRHQEPTFEEIMREELKHFPWLALSSTIHVVIMLVLWFLFDEPPKPGFGNVRISQLEADSELYTEDEFREEIEVERPEEIQDAEFDENLLEDRKEAELQEFLLPEVTQGVTDLDILLTKVTYDGGLGDILKAGKSALSRSFEKQVSGMRDSGLEIVFVFDSTGSMGNVIQATKDRIVRIANVLLELVPQTRIGMITYRDHGEDESYLVRKVGLSRDFYRAINFMDTVYAAGGDDEPEAVHRALVEAVNMKWTASAKRLIILVGDAPPHKETERRIRALGEKFSKNGRSHIHAMITRPSSSSTVRENTERAFSQIARSGKGTAVKFEDEARILEEIMSLAFGRAEKQSLTEISSLAEGRSGRTTSFARLLVRRADLASIRTEFRKRVVPHDVVKAILQNPEPELLGYLVDFAANSSFSSPGRHAASFILQRLLNLREPPVNPESGEPITRAEASELKTWIVRRFK